MQCPSVAVALEQRAADVEQAGGIAGGDELRAGGLDGHDLVGDHRRGGFGVLDAEGAAEAAAFLGAGQVDQVDALDGAQQLQRPVADVEDAQAVARGVVRHPVGEVGPDVGDAGDVDDELRQVQRLVRAGLGHRGLGGGAEARGDHGVLVAHGAGAGAGRGDHVIDGRIGERVRVGVDLRQRLLLVSGVDVHLTATRLLLGEDDVAAEAGEDRGRGLDRAGEHHVADAGGEKRDLHVGSWGGGLFRGLVYARKVTSETLQRAVFGDVRPS